MFLNLAISPRIFAQGSDNHKSLRMVIRLLGVYDATVTVTPYVNGQFKTAIKEIPNVKDTITVNIPREYLPGQFLLRFDYRQKADDQPYPSEVILFMNKHDLRLGINPLQTQPDSLELGGDVENTSYFAFERENTTHRQQLILLEQLLSGYSPKDSKFFKEVEKEFEKKRLSYNQWISDQEEQNKGLFVSRTFAFQKVPATRRDITEEQQLKEQALHYFDKINLGDSLLLRVQAFTDFVTSYMRMFGMKATTEELRDSLFTQAGRLACEKAAGGHPKVYGWMVDYFYQGYETYAINSGIKMLEKHIQNPRCLTIKKQEIIRRLEGMKRLAVGTVAPFFEAEMVNEMQVRFSGISKEKSYGLLVFYGSDCSHCKELLQSLKKWYQKPENRAWFDVVTIAVDDDRELWKKFHLQENYLWTDIWAPGGINSQVANDYYILATPVMLIIDKDQKILMIPDSVNQIENFINAD